MTKREEINQAPPGCAGRIITTTTSHPCPNVGEFQEFGVYWCAECNEYAATHQTETQTPRNR